MLSSSVVFVAIAAAAVMPTAHFGGDRFAVVSAFNHQQQRYRQNYPRITLLQQQQQQRPSSAMTVLLQADSSSGSSDFDRPSTFLDEKGDEDDGATDINIVWLDEEDEEEEDGPTVFDAVTAKTDNEKNKKNRWEKLNPKIKQKNIEKGQAKAIANKAKREPAQQKKRRMMMEFKRLQQKSKKESMVKRPLPFDQRAPLVTYFPGMELTGVVISLTPYGAYVDVGTECDGLLHVSQFTRDFFVEHPRQMVSPGEEVTVKVRMSDPAGKKLHLTMLDDATLAEEMAAEKEANNDDGDDDDRIPLTDIELDDELWGELKRVTDFGAYVEVGAEVDGWLHFMDHPEWNDGMHPSEFMKKGQRVRVWVADRDLSNRRIRLTANRPRELPGPRFEMY